jgi:Tol biopolymer transport system component
LFLRETNLMAQPFDAGSAQFTGDAVALAQQVTFSSTPPQIAASASDTGTLVYLANGRPESQLMWLDRSGKKIGEAGPPARDFTGITLSPDGKEIAFVRSTPTGEDNVWLTDLERATETRLTSPPLVPHSPVWSRDGRRVAFGSAGAIYIKDVAGGGQEVALDHGDLIMPSDISQDGRWMVFTETDPKTAGDIWLLPDPLVPAANHKPAPFLRTPFNESQGQISPDGKWLAYTSNESGTDEVYIRPFPSGDGKWQISTGTRDIEPRWRADGKELFYLESPLGSLRRHRLMAVTIGLGATPMIASPKELFEFNGGGFVTQLNAFMYSPSPDGQRFVIKAHATDAQPTLNTLLNWQAGLKK